jgi:hypothetical protein
VHHPDPGVPMGNPDARDFPPIFPSPGSPSPEETTGADRRQLALAATVDRIPERFGKVAALQGWDRQRASATPLRFRPRCARPM